MVFPCIWTLSNRNFISRESNTRNSNQVHFTIFMIVGDLHFPLLWPQQRLGNLGNIMPLGLRPMEEVAGARLLHNIWPGEPSHLAEPVIAVDDGTILYSGICNDKFFICNKKRVGHLLDIFHRAHTNTTTISCIIRVWKAIVFPRC